MSFVQKQNRAVCIISASGTIANVTLRQPAVAGGHMTYKGNFDILSLSGSFLISENGGASARTGALSVCLSEEGFLVGGGIGGPLVAATTVQVIHRRGQGTCPMMATRSGTSPPYQPSKSIHPSIHPSNPSISGGCGSSVSHLAKSAGGEGVDTVHIRLLSLPPPPSSFIFFVRRRMM
ncbi:unnamed protein product [Spirodela intermedia]|uniref:AT-hook motif nuclear-localized protein n=1 Tax=Spirodela intermedia TaxID=51605 RepID=A0A7I8JD15_SPIIN|nr:unnamed protein product [Spirodela intermedia]CAA6667989.1 unnamed protein product [Spirodela intermedia]